MVILSVFLFLTVFTICIIAKLGGFIPEEFELHIFGIVKIRLKNKEKRLDDSSSTSRRNSNKIL